MNPLIIATAITIGAPLIGATIIFGGIGVLMWSSLGPDTKQTIGILMTMGSFVIGMPIGLSFALYYACKAVL